VGPAQTHQHPPPPHLHLGLQDPGRLQDPGHLPVPVLPLDPGLLLRLVINPNTSRRCTGRGTCATVSHDNPANISHFDSQPLRS
jgi:hypothetical protein